MQRLISAPVSGGCVWVGLCMQHGFVSLCLHLRCVHVMCAVCFVRCVSSSDWPADDGETNDRNEQPASSWLQDINLPITDGSMLFVFVPTQHSDSALEEQLTHLHSLFLLLQRHQV